MNKAEIIKEINKLKVEHNAVILAHNYQLGDVQDIADIVGDSLKLSQEAAKTNADIIIFCGVHFMAESAKILSPNKKVLLPVLDAGCPMADMISATSLKAFKAQYPGVPVVCYVNSSAEVKAECDVTCTSSNALNIVKSLGVDKVIFAPDRNLGSYINDMLEDVEVICYEGFCITHERVTEEEIILVKQARPHTEILVHPECNPSVVQHADFVGSTSQIIQYAKKSNKKSFIIGTEMGILHTLEKENPDKKFYILSPSLICANMKKTKLEDVYYALKDQKHEIKIDEKTAQLATKALNIMVETN